MKEGHPCPCVSLLASLIKTLLPSESSSSQVADEKLPPSEGHLSRGANAPRTTAVEAYHGVDEIYQNSLDFTGSENNTYFVYFVYM